MSEVRTCEECGAQHYASEPGAAVMRTVETVEDGTLTSEERLLCGRCYEDAE